MIYNEFGDTARMAYYCRSKLMFEAFMRYQSSDYHSIYQAYRQPSNAKAWAWATCIKTMMKYEGTDIKIIGSNTNTFSVGFIGIYNGREAFFYITKEYVRAIWIADMKMRYVD